MADHQWLYQINTLLGSTETLGPVDETEIISLVKAGKLTRETPVASPSRTKGGWHKLSGIPGLLKTLEQGEQERAAAKTAQQAERASNKQAAAEARQAEQQQRQQQQQLAQFTDCPDAAMANTIRERVKGILTANEELIFIAVQRKPLVNISPDALIATNRRLIFYRPKLLGRFEFQDFIWFDLHNAHIQQNMLGAVFSAQHTNGQILTMDYLTREGSQALYRLAQEKEEAARLQRHQLHIDTIRAGASQVNVNTSANAPAPPTAQAAPQSAGDDAMKRLQTLKQMADSDLITPEEFAQRKKEILSQI